MRHAARIALGALLVAASALAAHAQAPKPATAPAPARPAALDEAVATVNGEKITKRDVLKFLSNLEHVPGQEKGQYKYAVDMLVNTKLLDQYLKAKKIVVDEKEVDADFNRTAAEVKQQGKDLKTELAQNGVSEAEMRATLAQYLRWKAYMMQHSSDEELAKYIEKNRDSFNKSQVRASHILASVEPDAPPAERQKARQKLVDLKKQVEAGKMSFADAADKYSQDEDLVKEKSGGDLGFFERKGPFLEAFNAAAFALKKGEISEPVETDYGYHLIQVTDRKEGSKVDPKSLLAQFKEQILNKYAFDLQAEIVAEQRKTAKVDVKPMPADLFPPPPVLTVPDPAAPKPAKPRP